MGTPSGPADQLPYKAEQLLLAGFDTPSPYLCRVGFAIPRNGVSGFSTRKNISLDCINLGFTHPSPYGLTDSETRTPIAPDYNPSQRIRGAAIMAAHRKQKGRYVPRRIYQIPTNFRLPQYTRRACEPKQAAFPAYAKKAARYPNGIRRRVTIAYCSSKSMIDLRLAIRRSYSSLQPTTILLNSRKPVPAGIR